MKNKIICKLFGHKPYLDVNHCVDGSDSDNGESAHCSRCGCEGKFYPTTGKFYKLKLLKRRRDGVKLLTKPKWQGIVAILVVALMSWLIIYLIRSGVG